MYIRTRFGKGGHERAGDILHRAVINGPMQFCGRSFNPESLSPELQNYAALLEASGCRKLILRLDSENENIFLGSLEQETRDVLSTTKFPFQPSQRKEGMAHLLRHSIEERLKALGLDSLYNEIRVIEPERLSGLCEYDEEKKLELTDFGKMIIALKQRWPHLHVQYIRGRARDAATGLQRKGNAKNIEGVRAYRIPAIARYAIDEEQTLEPFPTILQRDIDLLAFTDSEHPTLEEIAQFLNGGVFDEKESRWWAEEKKSNRREFVRVNFGVKDEDEDKQDLVGQTIKSKKISLGHLFGTNIGHRYDINHSPLLFSMCGARIDMPIELVPYQDENGEYRLIGVSIDNFGGNNDTSKHRVSFQNMQQRTYVQALFPFPEVVLDPNELQELIWRIGYILRTAAWFDQMVVFPVSSGIPIPEADLEPAYYKKLRREIIDILPKATGDDRILKTRLPKQSQEILSNAIRHIYTVATQRRESFGTVSQRLDFGVSFIKDLADAFDGNVITTLLRLLPRGESITRDRRLFEIDMYGTGIIDINGVFTNLGRVLGMDEKHLLHALEERILTYARYRKFEELNKKKPHNNRIKDTLKTIENYNNWLKPEIYGKQGRHLFFDFLFSITQGNAKEVLALLKPAWCTNEEWMTMMDTEENIESLMEIDERFSGLNKSFLVPESAKESILIMLEELKRPVSVTALRKHFKPILPKDDHFNLALHEMEEAGLVTGFGLGMPRHEKEKSKYEPKYVWVCHSSFANQYSGDTHYSSVLEAVYLSIRDKVQADVDTLVSVIELPKYQINRILNALISQGRISRNDEIYSIADA